MLLPQYIVLSSLAPLSLAVYQAVKHYPVIREQSFAGSWKNLIGFMVLVNVFFLLQFFMISHAESFELISSLSTFVCGSFSWYIVHVAIKGHTSFLQKTDDHDELRHMVENLPAGAIMVRNEELIINKAAEEITGFEKSELRTLSEWFQKIYQERAEEVERFYRSDIQDPGSRPVIPIRRKDGSFRQVMFDAYKEGNHEVWILTDLTTHIESSQKFQVLFEHATDAYMIFDAEKGIIECNPAALTQLGFEKKEDLLKIHPAQFSPEYQPCGELSAEKSKRMDAIAMEKGIHQFEWVHVKSSGEEFPVLVTLNRVKLNHRESLFVIWHDLTEIKKNEAQASYAAKMSSLGVMASGLAHELNNPLAIINGKIQLLSMDLEDKDSLDKETLIKDFQLIEKTVSRMSKIIKALKTFSRQTQVDDPFEEVALSRVIDDTIYLCAARFRSLDIQFEQFLPDDVTLECRAVEISQVILNLVNNACDAVKNEKTRWIKLKATASADFVVITLSDSGPGISKNVASKLMVPFFTTKKTGEGTGLGLSISKGIIEGHNGKLTYRSDLPQTTFELYIPRKQVREKIAC